MNARVKCPIFIGQDHRRLVQISHEHCMYSLFKFRDKFLTRNMDFFCLRIILYQMLTPIEIDTNYKSHNNETSFQCCVLEKNYIYQKFQVDDAVGI